MDYLPDCVWEIPCPLFVYELHTLQQNNQERRGITIPNTNDGALTAFMVNMNEIRDQLLILTSYVDNHMDVLPDEIHWGHVGSARCTLELLFQINQFLNLD